MLDQYSWISPGTIFPNLAIDVTSQTNQQALYGRYTGTFARTETGLANVVDLAYEIVLTEYIRDDPIVQAVEVPKDETVTIIIPNCYSSIQIQQA